MLKKIIFPFVLSIMLLQLVTLKDVHAQDAWVCDTSTYSIYAMTETYQRFDAANFSIRAKIVYPNGAYVINKYAFIREQRGGRFNVTWYCTVNDNDNYVLDLDNPSNNAFPYHVNIFKFCIQHFQS